MALLKSKIFWTFAVLYISLLSFWLYIHLFGDPSSTLAYWFNLSYGLVALIGGLNGYSIAKGWGGFRSLIGKALILLSTALIFEFIAVFVWSFYNIILAKEVPYPSIADLFYFAVIPILASVMIYLAKASGAWAGLKTWRGKILALLIPAALLAGAYLLFLDSGFDTSDPVRLILDIGYPLGYSIILSLALLAYFLSQKQLGGVMKHPVLMVLGSYLILFFADYGFLYTTLNETYVNGGWVDLAYATALTALSISLVNFDFSLLALKSKLVNVTGVEQEAAGTVSTFNIYNTLILAIVKDQERIVGPIAVNEANSVRGLKMSSDFSDIKIAGNPEQVTNDLIGNFKTLFGDASVEIMKESINKAIIENPNLKEIRVNIKL